MENCGSSRIFERVEQFLQNSKYHQFFQSHEADYKQAAKAYSDSVLTKFSRIGM
jgi:hypothetical protein